MAALQDADLMSIGKHCAHEGCAQLDFLPFRCSRCRKVYCLEHRVCPCSTGEDTVLVCPLCAKAVICPPGSDVELVFDRHTRAECDPANYDKVHRKQRCPVPGCKEKLTTVNSYTCKDCAVTVCLKHRLAADHKCVGRPAAAASAAEGRFGLPQSWRRMFSAGGTNGASSSSALRQQPQTRAPAAAAPAAAAAAASAGGQRPTMKQVAAAAAAKTRGSIQTQLQQYRQQQRQRGQTPAGAAAEVVDLSGSPARGPSPSGPELCQQCGARFATVQQLIEHAEAVHAAGWASGAINMQQRSRPAAAAGGLERCPHCGREFADAVALVAHVEQQHAAEAASTCVCS